MNTDEFWTIIDDVNARAGGDVLLKEEALSDSLSKREAADIHAFAGHLDRLRGQAYTWPPWAAVGRRIHHSRRLQRRPIHGFSMQPRVSGPGYL